MNYGYVEMCLGFSFDDTTNDVVALVSETQESVTIEYEVLHNDSKRGERISAKIYFDEDFEVDVNSFIAVIDYVDLGIISRGKLDEVATALENSGVKVRLNEFKPYPKEMLKTDSRRPTRDFTESATTISLEQKRKVRSRNQY